MISRIGICFIAVVLIVLTSSCAKIEQPRPAVEGQLKQEKLPDTNTIPLKWGRLISVTSLVSRPTSAQLWFQDEDGNVRVLPYNFRRNALDPEARLITRK